ncbi:MAG: hypothetical protein KIT72_13740 [Polyangiaceae bacterium]|nr:hypothetical protein [Polyangiaceae bacterium]MCW5791473.1 hypothetical protein [Polyangiaceae bacterium]
MAIAGLVTGTISLVAITVVAILPGVGFWALAITVLSSIFVVAMAVGGAALSSAMGADVGNQILASFNGPPFAEPAVVALWSIGSKSGAGSILVVPF